MLHTRYLKIFQLEIPPHKDHQGSLQKAKNQDPQCREIMCR